MIGYIIGGILVLLVLYAIFLYNEIIRANNETQNAFGSIDSMLKKRYDLIPNLVEVVKQYMIHEKTLLVEVTSMRSKYSDKLSSDAKIEIHDEVSRKLNNIMVSVENYPDLKANQYFLKLQAAWNEAEEQISASRRFYNSAVTWYNNTIQTFPSNIIAGIASFTPKKVFEISEVERKNINAKDLFN